MSYIGQEPVVGRYIKIDQISGGFNGTASGFTLAAGGQGVLPGTARNLMLSLGGVIQEPETDFTISGSGITFTTPPVSGTTFFCVVFGDMQAAGTPSDGTVLPSSISTSGTFVFPNVTVSGTTVIASGTAAAPSLAISGDLNTGLYSPGADQVAISTSGTKRLELNATGQVLINRSSIVFDAGTATPQLLIDGATAIGATRSTNDAGPGSINLGHARGTSYEILQTNDATGLITFQGGDGTQFLRTAEIRSRIEGTPGVNDLGGNILFSTRPTGVGAAVQERLRITSAGLVGVGTSSPQTGILDLTRNGTAGTVSSFRQFRIGLDTNGNYSGFIGYGASVIGQSSGLIIESLDNGAASKTIINPSGGNVGIGITSPQAIFSVSDGTVTGEINPYSASSTCFIGTRTNHPVSFQINASEKVRIDTSGRLLVGTSSASGAAILQVQTPTTYSATLDDGVSIVNTSTKTYPTTGGFDVTAGLYQGLELGTNQIIDAVTPGSFNYVSGMQNLFTKSAGNTQDIERLYFYGIYQAFNWTDANTCKQYAGISDTFFYRGINANGRISSSFTAQNINLIPPDGGTQTITNVTAINALVINTNSITGTVNITNGYGISPAFISRAIASGTNTTTIGSYTFLGSSPAWGTTATGSAINNTTITSLYGLRLTPPSSSTGLTVTNNWGISQEWSSAKNWFAGASNQFPNITTTASGANAFLDSADSNRLYRSTSSIVYKKDVENLDHALADNIHQFRPVWYRSNCDADCQDWSWFGLIAEEVAAIEPRLVHYGYQEDAYELVDITDTVELQPNDPRREAGQETEEVTKQERRLKDDAQQVPNGVAYDRLTVLLLDVVQRQEDRIKDLEARLSALEAA